MEKYQDLFDGLVGTWKTEPIQLELKDPNVKPYIMLNLIRSHTCIMPKRQAAVIFPEVNYELSLVMENVKRESWRRSTSSPKIVILVLIMHTAWSPNTSS
jgi:hypothetical protein